MEIISKREAMQILVRCAKLYEAKLRDKNLLIVTMKKSEISYIEIEFPKHAFLHLTGVATSISPNQFYKKCLNTKLSLKDFEFNLDGTTKLKLMVLPQLLQLDIKMIAEYNGNRPKLYTEKLAGNIRGCLGLIKSSEHGGFYVPNTTLKTDMRDEGINQARVLFILTKEKKEELYSNIVYTAKDVNIEILKDITKVNYGQAIKV